MRFRHIVLGLMLCAGPLAAQQTVTGHPFTKRPVTQEELARAIERSDMTLLNVTPVQYHKAITALVADGVSVPSVTDLAAYIRRLAVVPCPSGKAMLSRVLKPGNAVDMFWPRDFRPGELCLLDNNANRLIVSLACGNVIWSPKAPAMIPAAPPAPPKDTVKPLPKPAPVEAPVVRELTVTGSDSLSVVVRDPVIRYLPVIRKDTTFTFAGATVFAKVTKTPPAPPQVIVQKGSFWTSKKLWIPLALVAGGTGGYFLGQERVTCSICGKK